MISEGKYFDWLHNGSFLSEIPPEQQIEPQNDQKLQPYQSTIQDDDSESSSSDDGCLFIAEDKKEDDPMQKEVSPSKKEVSPSKKVYKDEDDILIRRKVLAAMPPMELTSIRRQYSLRPDMIFGWKPEDIHGAPIPMNFDYESGNLPIDATSGFEFPIYYIGKRYNDSLGMHR